MKKLTTLFALTVLAPLTAQDPGPAPEHKKLAEQVGTWDAAMEYLDFETGKPTKSKGVSIRKQPLGELWLIDTFQADMGGMTFKGTGTTGYDPNKKKYVGTWIDSMTPHLMVMEGSWDDAGKVLTMVGDGLGMDGKPAKHVMKTTVKSKDEHVFEMFLAGPDGKDVKLMTITYTRRVRKHDEVGK